MFSMYHELLEDFFASDRMECIVNEKVLTKRGWEIGDRICLNCYYYDASSAFHKVEIHPMGGLAEVEIVATMADLAGKTNAIRTDVVLPARTAQNIFKRFDLPFFADTVFFHVKDPLNLGDFKEEMQEIGFFITSATDLRRAIELMQSFFPVVCILVLLIGYVVSYLSGNSRKDEFALLRLQELKKVRASVLFLSEQMLLVLASSLVGGLVMLLTEPAFSTAAAVNGVILIAYLIGAAQG